MTPGAGDLFDRDRGGPDLGAGPGRAGQVIRLHPKTGEHHLDWLTWGLAPASMRNSDTSPRPIFARAETVAELPMFADAFRHRRALVPAAEYYQRPTKGELGRRYAIARKDGRPWRLPVCEVSSPYLESPEMRPKQPG